MQTHTSSEPAERFRRRLSGLRRRILLARVAGGLLGAGVGLAGGFLAWLWISSAAPPEFRKIFSLLTLTLGAATALGLAFLQARSGRGPLSTAGLARHFLHDAPEMRDLVRTGADLSSWGSDGARERGVSPELAAAQVRVGATALGDVRTGPVREPGSLLPWILALAGLLTVATAWLIVHPDAFELAVRAMRQTRGITPLAVGNLSAEITPPAYMNRPANVSEGTGGRISGFPGSRVRLGGRVDSDLLSGSLIAPGDRRIPLEVSGRDFEVRWILDKEGTYNLSFSGAEGPLPADFVPQPVELLQDQRPKVDLIQPESDLEGFGDREIRVSFSARDDFSVDRAELVLSGEKEVRLEIPLRPAAEVAGEISFLPLTYPELGSGAYLSVEAHDNDTISGPKVGASRSVYLAFQSRQDLLSSVSELEERLFESLILHLGDHLEIRPAKPESQTKARSNAADLLTLLRELTTQLGRTGEIPETPGALAILSMESGLIQVLQPFVDGGPSGPEAILELERDVLFLDRLLRSLRMEEALLLGDELNVLEQALFERLEEGGDPQDMLPLLQKIQELLSRMSSMLAQNASQMPDVFANSDAVSEMPRSELQETLEKLAEAMKNGDRKTAGELAEQLLEQMNEWMAALEDAAQKASEQAFGMMAGDFSELLEEIRELIGKQEGIMEKTSGSRNPGGSPPPAAADPENQELRQRIEKRLQAIAGNTRTMETMLPVRKMHPKGFGSNRSQGSKIMESRSRMNGAMNEIRRRYRTDRSAARDASEALDRGFSDFSTEVRDLLAGDPNQPSAETLRQATRTEIEGLKQDLERLGSTEARPLTPKQVAALNALEQKQKGLRSETESFSERLGEAMRNLPFLPPDMTEKTGQAGQSMGQAAEQLGKGRPGGSIPHQTDALERLSEVSGALQSAQKKMEQGMSGQGGFQTVRGPRQQGPGQGRDVDRSPVEIPRETEARELRGFREDVMKAMRSGPYPREYKSDVEAYYERLIK